jgi:predicted DNA-binding transcriptional regulator YafY
VDGQQEHTTIFKNYQNSLKESKLLTFEYADRYGNKTARTAEPYQLVLKSSHWYWQGYCHKRNDFRLFKLSRTSNLQIQEEFFTPRDYQKPQLDFTDILATIQTKIKIRIHKSVMDRYLIIALMNTFRQTVMSIAL